MRVFLIHGMGRGSWSLASLGRKLARAGHAPSHFGYSVRRAPLADIAASFADHVTAVCAGEPGAPYAVIGHSLGNVITRLASPRLPPGFARFAMLAPPNRSPALARAMRKNPLYAALTGDAGQRLGDHAFYDRLPIPDVPTLVIAGQTNPPPIIYPYRGAPSDGIVGVHETELRGARHEVIPALHSLIMNDRRALALLLEFLNE
jgi:pimeloyl-ACP methyl ester carboxylesterase